MRVSTFLLQPAGGARTPHSRNTPRAFLMGTTRSRVTDHGPPQPLKLPCPLLYSPTILKKIKQLTSSKNDNSFGMRLEGEIRSCPLRAKTYITDCHRDFHGCPSQWELFEGRRGPGPTLVSMASTVSPPENQRRVIEGEDKFQNESGLGND